ncbi:hypothetical protein EXIGLDRAFT_834047 [Exidia glandulosa HHB12029]|uniref:Uncharacterized protein n=1 Tax=Exidia glandulosa HHB12029 TaxID=1314781 RepID=A0A165K6W2_EXIGL|nr:hypothetical protein EXIGLDRAFT_834047 [Exidia glandulosa HHB12029]
MSVPQPLAPAAPPVQLTSSSAAASAPQRTFVPLHKLRRRTATSVCAGHFDEVATPRGGIPKYTPLSGVENVDWLGAVRRERERQGYANSDGAYGVATHAAGRHKSDKHARRHGHPGHYAAYDPYLDDEDEYDYGNDLYSDLDDDDDELGARSVASSVTSRTSSRPPHTPYDFDFMSPTSVSPTFTSTSYPFPPAISRRYTTGDVNAMQTVRKTQGKTRPRAESMTSDPDIPLAKRYKVDRFNSSTPVNSKNGHSTSHAQMSNTSSAQAARARKAARKGWKGWVEVEDDTPAPPTLIKLDAPAVILPQRRTRSGKNFDGIGVGDGNWI